MQRPANAFVRVPDEELAFLGTGGVPARPFYDPDIFEQEREGVWRRSWIPIAHVCEMAEPDAFLTRRIEVLAASILLSRSPEGEIAAFHNVCTHRGTELVLEAAGRAKRFRCPYHSWTFGQNGALLAAPDFERFGLSKKDCGLPPIHVGVHAGLIFVNLSAAPPSLADWLGGAADVLAAMPIARATEFSEYRYEVDANWKLVSDNFQENYHVSFVHDRSLRGLASGPQNPFSYPQGYRFFGRHRVQDNWPNPDFTPQPVQAQAFGIAMAGAASRGYARGATAPYLGLFPNLFAFGASAQFFTQQLWPLSHDRTRGVIRFYYDGPARTASERFEREFTLNMFIDIHSEDIAIVESGQRGLATGALRHIHFQSQEALCRHFFNAVQEMMAEPRLTQAPA